MKRMLSSWRASFQEQFVVDVLGPGHTSSHIPCVVTGPWRKSNLAPSTRRALLNPANSELVGTARAYFPRGGPLPPPPPPGLERSSSGWGGLDAGSGMLYPLQVVDGLTHMHAGLQLRKELSSVPFHAGGAKCNIGAVVLSEAHGLASNFDVIAHSPTPFWPSSQSSKGSTMMEAWRRNLGSCYSSAILALAQCVPLKQMYQVDLDSVDNMLSPAPRPDVVLALATPLLGAGAAGAPPSSAAAVAIEALARISTCNLGGHVTVRFVLNDVIAKEAVENALHEEHEGLGRLRLFSNF